MNKKINSLMNNKLIKEVMLDYQGNINNKRATRLKFNHKISKSKVYVSNKTGTVFHSPSFNSEKSLNKWSKNIYSKKIDTANLKYTANNPIMRSRHYYSALFINRFLKSDKIKFCDFASGEGNFVEELLRVNNKIQFNFTEHSKILYKKAKKKIKSFSKKNVHSFNGSIENSIKNKNLKNLDACSLLWTLCNCVKPIDVLNTIHSLLKKDGIILISESSRILVPFKKPIYNCFVSKFDTQNTHPWFFSYNSLSNLLEITGFRIIKHNRYFDENDLVIVAKKQNRFTHVPKIKIDKINNVKNFFKEWEKNSYSLKDNY